MNRCALFPVATVALVARVASATAPTYSIQQLGLTGADHQYAAPNGGGVVRSSVALGLNAAGQVIGSTNRYGTSGTELGCDVWLYTGASVRQIGLTGAGYGFASAAGTFHYDTVQQLNDVGQAIGSTSRYAPSDGGASSGTDAWLYTGTTTALIGLTGAGYEYGQAGTAGVVRRSSTAQALNNAGQATGTSDRYNALGNPLGQDAWLYSASGTSLVGLTGAGYEYTLASDSGGGTFRRGYAAQLTSAGQVIGDTIRYNSAGTNLGIDAWTSDGMTTRRIGLSGAGYEYASPDPAGGTYRYGVTQQSNAAGQVTGVAYRFDASGKTLGYDAWLFNGTTTTQIGLTGAGYEYAVPGSGVTRYAHAQFVTPAGQAAGYSDRYSASGNNLGADAWLYAGGITRIVGLTGAGYEYGAAGGTYRFGFAQMTNAVGQVAGLAERVSDSGVNLGVDPWVASATATQRVGLTGSDYEYVIAGAGAYRYSSVQRLTDAGRAVGFALRYTATGGDLGRDIWYYNGTTTVRIGLAGTGYEYQHLKPGTGSSGTPAVYDGTYRSGDAQLFNGAGQVVGIANRYSSAGATLGQDGWFYDPAAGITTPLSFGVSSAGYGSTSPAILTDAGVVLGSYDVYAGTTLQGTRAFAWSASDGFADLGSLVDGGLTAAQWQKLANAFAAVGQTSGGWPQYVVGSGLTTGVSGADIYLLAAVSAPEPASLLLLATAAAPFALARRRRASPRRGAIC